MVAAGGPFEGKRMPGGAALARMGGVVRGSR